MGATTIEEYRKYIEKDTALARRFQVESESESESECYFLYSFCISSIVSTALNYSCSDFLDLLSNVLYIYTTLSIYHFIMSDFIFRILCNHLIFLFVVYQHQLMLLCNAFDLPRPLPSSLSSRYFSIDCRLICLCNVMTIPY
jgi:hypothetical protein